MSEMLPLFDLGPSEKTRLQEKVRAMTAKKLYLGTSSWKYEGWLNQIYTPERYWSRGKFSRKRFEAECLAEYAEVFPIVCGDFSFYQFPTANFWQKLFSSAPRQLLFALKVPEDITVFRFPKHARYGVRSGILNRSFLDAELLTNEFLDPLSTYRERIPIILFEFGAFPEGAFTAAVEFADVLNDFFACLPNTFQYGVEIRNAELLQPAYFATLRQHGTCHVLNAWTRMPTISAQMELAGALTADFTVARALLRTGRPYEEAVTLFSPYQQIQEPNPEVRDALRRLLARARRRGEPTYLFVNNRLEGNAPGTIDAILDAFDMTDQR